MAPRKTAGLVNLQRQLDAAFPNRKRPDGWIADAAHTGVSGHHPDDTPGEKPSWNGDPDTLQEVRSLDVAADLGDGVTGRQLVNHLIRLPQLATVIRYLIHDRKIYHSRVNFQPATYTGASPHTEHIHIEGAFTQAADNNTTYDYRLQEIPVALTPADKAFITEQIDKAVSKVAADVWARQFDRVDAQPGQTAKVTAGALLQFSEKTVREEADRVIAALQDNAPPPPPEQ